MDVGPALRQATLDRGISLLGNARSLDPLFSTLHAGKPIVLGVFGASVAQNAGCLAQPHKRCMWYSGKRNVTRAYGRPSKRPFKGFAVRLYDHIQREFPHPDHQINNSALDATPVQVALPCLFSHMPVQMHLVLLDFGSMATNLDLTAIEGVVRALLSLKPPPALLLLSVQEWCTQHIRPRKLYQVGQLLTGQSTRDNVYPDTPWSRAETETLRVCQHYGQACVSVRRALEPHVYAHEANFSLHDVVGEDCLHPINGRYGVSYVAQLLTHWFDVALASWSRTRRDVPRLLRPKKKMKAPLYPSNEKLKPMRCYGFKARDDVTGQALHPIAWCSGPNTFGLSRKSAHSPSCWGMPENSCPSHIFRSGAHATKAFKEFVQDAPHFWFHCRYALSMASRKISPGVRRYASITPPSCVLFCSFASSPCTHCCRFLGWLQVPR